MITIENDGPEIRATNYWDTPLNTKGAVVGSLNAGALRLLIPDCHKDYIREMRTGKEVIVSKAPYRGRMSYEFLFEDYTDSPFSLIIEENQMVPVGILDSEDGKAITVSVWSRGLKKEMELPGRFRVVTVLPCLLPWGEDR